MAITPEKGGQIWVNPLENWVRAGPAVATRTVKNPERSTYGTKNINCYAKRCMGIALYTHSGQAATVVRFCVRRFTVMCFCVYTQKAWVRATLHCGMFLRAHAKSMGECCVPHLNINLLVLFVYYLIAVV